MNKLLIFLFKLLTIIPFSKFIFIPFYFLARTILLKKVLKESQIVDLLITSDLSSKDFIYGQSDYNILIIVKNNSKPREILAAIKNEIDSHPLTKVVFNTQYIPVMRENEFETDLLKTYLLRSTHDRSVNWSSIIFQKKYTLKIAEQYQYAGLINSFINLDFNLFRMTSSKSSRSKIKNIYRSVDNLSVFFPQNFQASDTYKNLSHFAVNFSFISKLLYIKFLKYTWEGMNYSYNQTSNNKIKTFVIPNELETHLKSICEFEFIDEITLTPSVIQDLDKKIEGKLFIEVHINQKVLKSKYLTQLNNLKDGIKDFQSESLKLRVRIMNLNLYELQMKNAFYSFPLEPLYRNKRTYFLNNHHIDFKTDKRFIIHSSIHFLISQVMRFRSYTQKSSLIGSKFVKSLNLMFRYYQIAHYLKYSDFLIINDEKEIRELLTPQFSHIAKHDIVTEKDWMIIKAQLLYFLKQIKSELIKYDASLKNLHL